MNKPSSISYFDYEGRQNLPHVLRVVKRALKIRLELRAMQLIIFTATGDGPALAYGQLHQYEPRIVAVTFPPDFHVRRREGEVFFPRVEPKLEMFFKGVGIKTITGRLPFDKIENLQSHNEQMRLIRDVLTLFGGSFSLSIQSVLSACDFGAVAIGEKVISITGDTASIVTASTTQKFLTKEQGLVVNEILCKPRNLTLSRATAQGESSTTSENVAEKQPAGKLLDLPRTAITKFRQE
jgi:hypothetical protein